MVVVATVLEDWAAAWLALAAGASGVALGGALVAFGLGRGGRGGGGGSPRACGRCGYDVRGLPTFTCPECGSDLREVGIVSDAAPNAVILLAAAVGSSWRRLLLCTLAVMV